MLERNFYLLERRKICFLLFALSTRIGVATIGNLSRIQVAYKNLHGDRVWWEIPNNNVHHVVLNRWNHQLRQCWRIGCFGTMWGSQYIGDPDKQSITLLITGAGLILYQWIGRILHNASSFFWLLTKHWKPDLDPDLDLSNEQYHGFLFYSCFICLFSSLFSRSSTYWSIETVLGVIRSFLALS